jgi:small subunit ribosomal protein S2
MHNGPIAKAELVNDGESVSIEGDATDNGAPDAAPDVSVDQDLLREMIAVGLCYGRSKAKTHPRMKPHIFATRNGIELIDVAWTWQMMERAQEALKTTVAAGQQILMVGTQPSAHESVRALAEKFALPYVIHRWLGGTLTNFKTISRRVFLKNIRRRNGSALTGRSKRWTRFSTASSR